MGNIINKNKNNINQSDNDFGVSSIDIKDDIIEHIVNNINIVTKEEYEQIKKASLEANGMFYENLTLSEAKEKILLYGKTKKRIDILKLSN